MTCLQKQSRCVCAGSSSCAPFLLHYLNDLNHLEVSSVDHKTLQWEEWHNIYYTVWIFKGLDGVKVTQILTGWSLKFKQICFVFHVKGFAICFWYIKNAEGNLLNCLKENNKGRNKLAFKSKDLVIHKPSAKSKQLVKPASLQPWFWATLPMLSNIFFSLAWNSSIFWRNFFCYTGELVLLVGPFPEWTLLATVLTMTVWYNKLWGRWTRNLNLQLIITVMSSEQHRW